MTNHLIELQSARNGLSVRPRWGRYRWAASSFETFLAGPGKSLELPPTLALSAGVKSQRSYRRPHQHEFESAP